MLELIGLGDSLVERTCSWVLEHRRGNDLSAAAVVFPSKRFGFFLRQELARAVGGNFFPPALFPIEAFFEELFRLNAPGVRMLNELEAAHAVHESCLAVFPGRMYGSRPLGDFASFLPWAQKVLASLEEIQSEGGRTQGIHFEQYEQFTELGEYHLPYKEFIRRIPELLADLGGRLGGRMQATRGMACRRVADLAAAGALETPPAARWAFSGFNAMNSSEKALFRFFRAERRARLFLRSDPAALDDPRSPFHLQAETLLALDMEKPAPAPPSPAWNDLAGKVVLHPCDGVESEVYHAYRLLEEACRGRDEEGRRRVAVLLPSPATLIPFVQGAISRFDQGGDGLSFNITLGYPLERTPMMQLVESMLAILEHGGEDGIAAEDYLQLIRHPYVKISGGGGDREPLKRGIHLLEDIIHGQNLTRFTAAGLEAALEAEIRGTPGPDGPELAAAVMTQVAALHRRFIPQGVRDVPALLAFLRGALESVGSESNRGAHLFLNEYAAAALAALEELEEFAASRQAALWAADAAGMAALVRGLFRGRTIRFEGSPLQGVQVMGPLEFRGLSFDEVIVLDALEGILPGTAKYDPILPADIRAIFAIRDHGDWEKVYAFNFFSLLGAAGCVHILYPRRNEEGQDHERSRYIERIAYEIEKRTGAAPAASAIPLPFAIGERKLKRVEKTAAVRARLDRLPLSPSSLETYVRCPLQFYFRKVLGLEERPEVAAESEGGLIGTIAHEALKAFYEKYPDAGAMAGAGGRALDAELQAQVEASFRRLHFDPGKGLERIRAWGLVRQLGRFVREDRERLAAGGVRVGPLEEWLGGEHAVPGRSSPAVLKGRLDRCETQGERLRIIDYKTGVFQYSPAGLLAPGSGADALAARSEGEYLRALAGFGKKYPGLQLLVYLLLAAQARGLGWERLDGAYVLLRSRDRFFKPLFPMKGKRELGPGERDVIMQAFDRDLGLLLGDLYSRDYFLANPEDERHCSYCPFRLPCGNL
ncbi:MAG TPA: PD-(D/E)XK nuclease family protein [Candidatus Aminicenantes bacterium]|nr:PD-(D/E)XK nuclease family protein [Candidatus Aminicenantes bacterium]